MRSICLLADRLSYNNILSCSGDPCIDFVRMYTSRPVSIVGSNLKFSSHRKYIESFPSPRAHSVQRARPCIARNDRVLILQMIAAGPKCLTVFGGNATKSFGKPWAVPAVETRNCGCYEKLRSLRILSLTASPINIGAPIWRCRRGSFNIRLGMRDASNAINLYFLPDRLSYNSMCLYVTVCSALDHELLTSILSECTWRAP